MTTTTARKEADFNARATAAGNEVLTAPEAARLFDVAETTIRQAASAGKIAPEFTMALTRRKTPLYRLSVLVEYFAGRYAPDPDVLARMRANGRRVLDRE